MAQILGTYPFSLPYYYEVGSGIVPPASVWCQAPMAAYHSDPGAWFLFFEDFHELTIGTNTFAGWTFTAATTGTVAADATVPYGVALLSAGAVTAGQGTNFQCNQVPIKLHATLPTVFECRAKITGLSSNLKFQVFMGLAEINTAIIAANALAAVSSVGFAGVTTTGVISPETTATTTTTGATTKTIVDATYYRWGFVATTTSVQFYVNGVALGVANTTNIPTVAMAPSFVMQGNATVTPVLNLDYVAVMCPRV